MQSSIGIGIRGVMLAAVTALTLPLASPLAALADGDATSGVGVARLSLVSGSVAIQRGDTDAPTAAVVNAPILGADYVTTGDDSRAEVQFSGSSMVRLGDNVQVRFTHVDDGSRELQLAEGTIEVRTFGVDDHLQVDTPSVSLRPEQAGAYRITVDHEGVTRIIVRSGHADVVIPQGDQELTVGTTLVASGEAASPQITFGDPIAYDAFDSFNQERDTLVQRAVAHDPYVNPQIEGVEDLSEYGRWVNDPTYGEVWTPTNVAADWAPYRDGSWVWEPYYGWTWVAAEPWGWAPYHYGSWFHGAYGWAWYPVRPAQAYVWRPALVAFFAFGGGGGGVSFGIGSGNIGWVPLAPFEAYHPWYGRGYNNTTIINNTTIVNNYTTNLHGFRNTQVGGVTTISSQRFLQGRFAERQALSSEQLGRLNVVRGPVALAPTAANLHYSDRAVSPALAVKPAFAQSRFAGAGTVAQRVPFTEPRSSGIVNRPSYVAPTGGGAWDRFGNARGQATVNSPDRTYTPPQRSYQTRDVTTQPRTYAPPQRSYQTRDTTAQPRTYAPPQRSYQTRDTTVQPRTYAPPQRSYQTRDVTPQPRYYAPQRSYQQTPRATQRSAQPRSTAQPHEHR